MNKASTWTTRQTEPAVWDTLLPEQRERLEALGLKRRTDTATAAATTAASRAGAFERGIAALTQYAAREGRAVVPRAHVEETPHGPGRLGTWVSNTRSRRAKLSTEQRAALGIDWAGPTHWRAASTPGPPSSPFTAQIRSARLTPASPAEPDAEIVRTPRTTPAPPEVGIWLKFCGSESEYLLQEHAPPA
ncbi:helicase associated domain-containing protein [Streptomyces sp. st140]|uniref:helicase associated domain-containing protein n=1 Tax=Streptomyces sp. st140 TaxID=1828052 RepID=UPI000BF158C7|nr:helicase associated domain-containing protein [Streptomyces sp. st140]